MHYALIQIVALHAAFTTAFGNGRAAVTGHGFGGGSSGFPSCANDCFDKFTSSKSSPCASGDSKCICQSSLLQQQISCCADTTCNLSDQGKAFKFVTNACSAFDAPDAGICHVPKASAGATNQQSTAPIVTIIPDPVTVSANPVTVPVSIPVTIPATVTSVVLQTSVQTASSLVVVTSVQTLPAAGTAAVSSTVILSTSASLELVTTILSSTDVETADTTSTSIFESISTPDPSTFFPTASTPAPVLSATQTASVDTKKGMSAGGKAGIAIAVLLGLAVLSIIPFFFWRRRKQTLDREFQELKDAHESNVGRPLSRVVPLYPRPNGTTATATTGPGYRDIFDPPDGPVRKVS